MSSDAPREMLSIRGKELTMDHTKRYIHVRLQLLMLLLYVMSFIKEN